MSFFVLKNPNGKYWQTAKGFLSTNLSDATKYDSRADAEGAYGFVVKEPASVLEIK